MFPFGSFLLCQRPYRLYHYSRPRHVAKHSDVAGRLLGDLGHRLEALGDSAKHGVAGVAGAAIAFGMQFFAYAQCVKDGGCKNIKPIAHLEAVSSRGLSVFKNAPNPEATKIFVNWVLSKEGQEVFVKEWAAANESGAVSMRKDVEPHPLHKRDLPDFARARDYVWVHTNEGAKEVDAVVRIFKEVVGR